MTITAQDAQNLKDAIRSLRAFSRADLKESRTGDSLVDGFYEEPYPTGHLLSETKSDRHTFVVGRRGSGKSTVFQKARLDLRANSKVLTAYVNLKSVSESASYGRIDLPPGAPGRHAQQIIWFRSFIKHLIKELSTDLRRRNSEGFFRFLSGRKEHATRELKKLEDENGYLHKLDLDTRVDTDIEVGNVRRTGLGVSVGADLGGPSLGVALGAKTSPPIASALAVRDTIFSTWESSFKI
jgi:hypothetical protein